MNWQPKNKTLNIDEPIILAIESSCDETAVAITANNKIKSNFVVSQIKDHRKYGGVVPELASRKHTTSINFLIENALAEAKISMRDIKAIAVSKGPGLVGALMVGMTAAKTLALVLNLPLIAVNHIEAHIFSLLVDNHNVQSPFLCLVVSGGHTMLVLVKDFGEYQLLGETLDDAAGEAFDKIAKFLNLAYPGGPQIEKVANFGDENKYQLPRPMIKSKDYNFSFSGLKTAVIYLVKKIKAKNETYKKEDVAASFQKAVVDVLISKTVKAASEYNVNTIGIVGGVASNCYLRERFQHSLKSMGIKLVLPSQKLSTDNAVMVGLAANHCFKQGKFANLNETVDPNLRLLVESEGK